MNLNTHRWYAVSAGLLVLVVAVGWYLGAHNKAIAPTTQNPVASSTNATTTGQAGTNSGSVGITGIPNMSGYPAPDLNRPYMPPANLPASVQAQSKQTVANAIQQLKIDPNHLAYWLELAIYRKGSADYVGAEEIWVYCTKVWPTDPTAYNNLADLYGNYLHDYPKAVANWNEVIKLQPKNVPAYLSLASLYNINMKDRADAQATLQAGLKENPSNSDLQYALDHLQ